MKPKLNRHLLWVFTSLFLAQAGRAQQGAKNADMPKEVKSTFSLKGGTSYSLMPSLKSFSISNNFGFFAGAYIAPQSSSKIGFRSELLLSRQGYDYASSQQTGNVMLTYLLLPQLTTLSVTRFLEFHAGAQLAVLLNASVDSSANPSLGGNLEKAKEYFNRVNYGVTAGLEVLPSKGSYIGARYNLFFDMYNKKPAGDYPAYVPNYNGNLKNGLLQLYVGFKF